MNIYYSFDDNFQINNPIVTTGSFDGVHLGHKSIINRLNNLAKQCNGESVLITFHPHPRKVLYPDTVGKELFLIQSQKEKIHSLKKTGLKHLFIIEFTREFSQISSIDYVHNILYKKLNAKVVVVGFNHNFGHNREGNYQILFELGQALNFWVEQLPSFEIEHESVSSTRIRKAIQYGEIQRANACLDDHYFILGTLNKIKDIFFVHIEEENKLLPPSGIYAVRITDGKAFSQKAIAVIKNFKETEKKYVEVYTNNEINYLLGKEIFINFFKEMKFCTNNEFPPLKPYYNKVLDWVY
jgi:riboflavin kinase/FMN adenylyltransferase